jgi:hypothetical protein
MSVSIASKYSLTSNVQTPNMFPKLNFKSKFMMIFLIFRLASLDIESKFLSAANVMKSINCSHQLALPVLIDNP